MPAARLDAFVPPPVSGRRADVLGDLAAALAALPPGRRVVAIDGVDGAGKTVLGHELGALVAPHREVHRASVDGFHRPAEQRYSAGRTARGFYLDSYDHAAIRTRLVASLWVEVPFEVSVPRGNARFGEVDATGADPASEVNARYVGGQRLYLADVAPATRATWVLDNTDLAAPVLG